VEEVMTSPTPAPAAFACRSLLVPLLSVLIAIFTPVSSGAAAQAPRAFDVPAGTADQTLRKFSEQAGVAVVFATDSSGSVRTNAVIGSYTTAEAISLLLKDSGLKAIASERTGTLTVTRVSAPNVARAAPTPAAARPAEALERSALADEVVELTPFTVNAAVDRGYQAENTLAGSRLRTNLKDVGTPITAFTEQFLHDSAITNTDDLAKYMVNTNYDLNEEANGQNGQITTIARPLKMRGLTGGDVTINFFKVGSRTDTFSTERIEQARGPNAILFGIGSAGGLINVTTKKARLNASSGSVAFQARSHDGTRAEVDYNQVILPHKLAFRLAAVNSRTNSWRNFAGNDAERLFGTVKFKLSEKMQVNAEFEIGHMERAVKRTATALDAFTPWRDAGSVRSATASAAQGIATLGANAYLVFDSGSGTLSNWRNKMKTANAASLGGQPRVLTDFSVLPRETSITGPGFEQAQDYKRYMASFDYALTRDWSLEIAAVRQDEIAVINDNQQVFEQYLYADPNPALPNGAVNPNAGRAYVEAQPLRVTRNNRTDRARAIMSYSHDFGRLLGRHTLAGVAEYGWTLGNVQQGREYVVSPNAPSLAAPENVNNRVYRRTYVDLNGPSDRIVLANPWAVRTSGLADTLTGSVYQTALIPFGAGTQITETRTFTTIAMLQSAFWRKRLHTVVGVSHDQRTVTRSTQDRTPLPGFATGVLRAVRGTVGADDPRTTNFTFSGVFHATGWLALSYSQSRNNDVPNNTAAIIYAPDGVSLTRFKAAQGQSEDIGFRLDLFKSRVFLNALYYQTSATGDNEFATGVNNADMNNIWGALNRDGVIDPLTGRVAAAAPEASTAQTYDQRSQGYELSLTANLTPHWRFVLSGSRSTATRTHIGPEMVAHLAAVRPLWEANRTRALANPSGDLATIGDMLRQIDAQALTSFVVADGRRPIGQIPNKFTARSAYDFTVESLRGASVGGGVRYLGKPVIGVIPGSASAAGVITPFRYYHGSEQVFVDFNVSYRRKLKLFSRPITWSLQLNVDNLLGNDAIVRLRVSDTGALQNYRFNDPREWILTSRFTF